jgi:hypothetical protein
MFATAVIVLRETLEAALIVSIVLAATRGIVGRRRWIGGGVATGVAGALVIAGLTEAIAGALQGIGQELLNAAILVAAVAMLAWHHLWMAVHGRSLLPAEAFEQFGARGRSDACRAVGRGDSGCPRRRGNGVVHSGRCHQRTFRRATSWRDWRLA